MANEGRIIYQKSPAELGLEPSGERNYAGINEETEVLASESNSTPSRDTGKFSWSWLFGKFLSKIRSYLGDFTEDDFDQPQMIPNVLYTAANKTQTRNTETLTFTEDGTGGFGVPLTGNLTFDFTDAKNGVLVVLRHNSPTVPTFSQQPISIGGTGYQTGVNNLIFLRYIFDGTNHVVYSEIVQENAAVQQVGGAVDGHTHSNKSVLDAISNAGSGEIITTNERNKLSRIFGNLIDFLDTPVQLNNKYPTSQEDDVVFLFSTDTYWKYSSGAWSDTGSGSVAAAITANEVKTLYESNANTNVFTDLEKSKLQTVQTGATDDLTGAEIEGLLDAYYGNTDWKSTDYGLKGISTFSASSDLLLAWANEYVRGTSASATNVTVQPEATIAHVAKTVTTIRQVAAGQITLVAGSGVTFNVRAAEGLKTAEQHAEIQLTYIGSNVWDVRGGVV